MTSTTSIPSAPPFASLATRLSPLSIAALLCLALIWGLSIPITKLALESMPPMTLTALRFGIAVPILFLFALGHRRLPLRALPQVVALGLLGIGIGQVAQTFGIVGTSASVGTVISAVIPVLVVVFAALRLHQPVTGWQRIGLAAAFAGIALVASGQGDGSTAGQTTALGVLLMLISALAIAFYYVWSVELTASHGTVTVAAWSTLAGFLALLPFTGWEIAQTPFRVEPVAVAAAAYLGLLVTAAGLFLWLWLLRTVPARIAASVQFLQPLFGIAASAALFGDKMGLYFALGVVLVLLGVGLTSTTLRARKGPDCDAPPERKVVPTSG
ncbi:DMT family transporter [Phaeovulum sp.]|uniref:DMT family transporter n=1 Tax=Phaeovulum sp. TaxID=2934796 RepID=UPI0039E32F08